MNQYLEDLQKSVIRNKVKSRIGKVIEKAGFTGLFSVVKLKRYDIPHRIKMIYRRLLPRIYNNFYSTVYSETILVNGKEEKVYHGVGVISLVKGVKMICFDTYIDRANNVSQCFDQGVSNLMTKIKTDFSNTQFIKQVYLDAVNYSIDSLRKAHKKNSTFRTGEFSHYCNPPMGLNQFLRAVVENPIYNEKNLERQLEWQKQ